MASRHPRDQREQTLCLRNTGLHCTHDDVMKWKHFPRNWPFVQGIHRSPVKSPHKGQWRGALMFSLICVWINDWVNNREAGYLRHYRTHYDAIVMPAGVQEEPTVLNYRPAFSRKISRGFEAARLCVRRIILVCTLALIRNGCQISERLERCKPVSYGFEASQDLALWIKVKGTYLRGGDKCLSALGQSTTVLTIVLHSSTRWRHKGVWDLEISYDTWRVNSSLLVPHICASESGQHWFR